MKATPTIGINLGAGVAVFFARNNSDILPVPFHSNCHERLKTMTSSKKWCANQTQVFCACIALIEERTINHRTEIREVRGWRLGAIIHRLKTGFKWPIEVDYRGTENTAYFKLSAGTDTSKLKFPKSAKALLERDAA